MLNEMQEALLAAQLETETINSLDLYLGDDESALYRLLHISRCRKKLCKECKEVTRLVCQHSTKHLSPRYDCDIPFCGQLLALMKDTPVLTPGPCLFTVQYIRENMARIIDNID
ncbi:uncharacterized protein LOC118406327 [Branchiostoma floridae]|uniref:Uncharacterized protein LOC118406327 n=1 Tax=Branchiostoma floridae TaxID=7739 RepID=A0A9J7HMJ3_BRAFL|nr:uncharacterized protein LOC118406327 [Branchiostoma floridae]